MPMATSSEATAMTASEVRKTPFLVVSQSAPPLKPMMRKIGLMNDWHVRAA